STSRCQMAKSAYCTGNGSQPGSPSAVRAAYAVTMSRVSGPIEKPSAAMWCTTRASTCSASDTAKSTARNGTWVDTSNPDETNAVISSTRFVPSTGTDVRSGTTSETGSTCWYPTPATSGYTVRSASWRPRTSATADCSAVTSSTPLNRITTGMLLTADSGS